MLRSHSLIIEDRYGGRGRYYDDLPSVVVLVVLERMRRGIPKQSGDEIELVQYRFTQTSFDSTYNPPTHTHVYS